MVYALGQHSVFQGFLYAVIPAFDKARTPAVAVVIFAFGAAVLAAFGLDRLRDLEDSPRPSPIQPRWAAWAALGFGVFVVALYEALALANKMEFPGDGGMLVTGFLALGLGALLFAWTGGSLTRK